MKDIIKCEWHPNEEWKHYETTYYVSNIGRVYNAKYNRLLKNYLGTNGYYRICINNKHLRNHRLVALLFCYNDDPINKTTVDHINNIKTDNHYKNLQWLSNNDNIQKANEKRVVEVDCNNNIIKEWESLTKCVRDTGLCISSISRVCSGVFKQTANRIFKYVD